MQTSNKFHKQGFPIRRTKKNVTTQDNGLISRRSCCRVPESRTELNIFFKNIFCSGKCCFFCLDFWFPAYLLSSFFVFLCFFASPLFLAGLFLCFSFFCCFPVFQFLCFFLCFFDFLFLCFSVSLPVCFSGFQFFLAFCFSRFPVFVFFPFPCFCACLLLCFSIFFLCFFCSKQCLKNKNVISYYTYTLDET